MNGTMDLPATMNGSMDHQGDKDMEMFDRFFPDLVDILTEEGIHDPEISQAIAMYKKVLEYNVPFGKKNRGLAVVMSYRHFVKDPTQENIKIARVLGWCVELLQALFLVTDDIMDHSVTRRGQPCWYKLKNVGMTAINDSFYLEGSIYKLLRKFIKDKPYYLHVMELFLQTTFQTVTGQCLDLTTAPPEAEVDFTNFTMAQHRAIVKWKTAFYSFYLPVALAMYMAGIYDEESHKEAKTILLEMGHFFQVQDDYLDCYGTPEIIGKIGTDIEDNKCGWLVVTALEMATQKQKEVLKENYGRWDKLCVQAVKDVYRDLDLEAVYKDYEEKSYQKMLGMISSLSGKLPKAVFVEFANRIYKREK